MTFPDSPKILLKFDEIVLFFGENFTEFRRNSRKSQLIYGNSDFFQKIRKIVLESWHNFDDRSSDNRQSSDYFSAAAEESSAAAGPKYHKPTGPPLGPPSEWSLQRGVSVRSFFSLLAQHEEIPKKTTKTSRWVFRQEVNGYIMRSFAENFCSEFHETFQKFDTNYVPILSSARCERMQVL